MLLYLKHYLSYYMPVSIIIGGQYGSEGKGKVSYIMCDKSDVSINVRVGGSNSGHTVFTNNGHKHILRHLPAGALIPGVKCVIGAGSYIDVDVLKSEIEFTNIEPDRLFIDPNAFIIKKIDKELEENINLKENIGSTLSGTGGSVIRRIERRKTILDISPMAKGLAVLKRYIHPVKDLMRNELQKGNRIVIEGSQGHGLSIYHSDHYPYTTSRDTSAAACLSEAGLSPRDVDQVIMVIRTYPIRVAGNSGSLPNEISWDKVTDIAQSKVKLIEYTSVTNNIRRVAQFDSCLVKEAIKVNNPDYIVLNHMDYIAPSHRADFVKKIEKLIGRPINFLGYSPNIILENNF